MRLEITTVKNCTVDCYPYCPQLKFREAYGNDPNVLSFENFKTVIDKLPREVEIDLSGFSEPFLNPKGLEMAEYLAFKGFKVSLYSTLVGLTPARVERLARIKFEHFCLHLPEPNHTAKIKITENYKNTLAAAITTMQINEVSIMNDAFISNERAANCDDAKPRHNRGPFHCKKLVTPEFVMLPNCDVVLCCMDWQMQHNLGNLLSQSYEEIMQSEAYRRIARNRWFLDGDTLCRSCKWATPKALHALTNAKEAVMRILYPEWANLPSVGSGNATTRTIPH
jgi:hypothetical protein